MSAWVSSRPLALVSRSSRSATACSSRFSRLFDDFSTDAQLDSSVAGFNIGCGECFMCQKKLSSGCQVTNDSALMNTMYGGRTCGMVSPIRLRIPERRQSRQICRSFPRPLDLRWPSWTPINKLTPPSPPNSSAIRTSPAASLAARQSSSASPTAMPTASRSPRASTTRTHSTSPTRCASCRAVRLALELTSALPQRHVVPPGRGHRRQRG